MNDYRDIIIEDLSETIQDLKLIRPTYNNDNRGSIHTTWSSKEYNELGIFTEDKVSLSKKNVLRGFHGDKKTDKLVNVLFGNVLEVVVDIRKNSKTYLKSYKTILNDNTKIQLLIPAGCVHAFYVLSDNAVYQYKLSTIDEGVDSQMTIKYDDAIFNINWEELVKNAIGETFLPILSKRDMEADGYKVN